MKPSRVITKLIFLITVMSIFLVQVRAYAASDEEYRIAAYQVNVDIHADGSVDIVDDIDFTFYDGFNNIMIPITKNPGEEIEIHHVYMLRKQELFECKRLLAGQWDAEVFTGTYSVIDEADHVKLKIYGSFYRTFGSVSIHYTVKNAVRRYQDIAEYQRIHIPKAWETRISHIHINVRLPGLVASEETGFWLHGVFVGAKTLSQNRSVSFSVPDTVPGEYVETRVIFPQDLVPECPVTHDFPQHDRIIAEELEYQASDKTDLLEARENAARKAGQKAFYERMRQRARNLFSILSIILALAAAYYILFMHRKLRQNKRRPLPTVFRDIDRLDPAEVRLLVSGGKTGARAMMGKLMELVSRGFISLGTRRSLENKTRFTFKMRHDVDDSGLNEADGYFMDWISGLSASNHEFDPIQLLGFMDSNEKAGRLKAVYDQWILKVKEVYHEKNLLDSGMMKYRNFGIVSGVLLLFLGFMIPITLAVALGYVLMPVGFFLLVYSLRIRKHTEYGIGQLRIWKAIRLRMKKNTLALDALPEWMNGIASLLGYGIVLGIEKDVARLIMTLKQIHNTGCECCLCKVISPSKGLQEPDLYRVVKTTLSIIEEAISSVQDA